MNRARTTLTALVLSWFLLGTTSCSGKSGDQKSEQVSTEQQQSDNALIDELSKPSNGEPQKSAAVGSQGLKIEKITAAEFKAKVFDYEKNTEWKYNGQIPAIVDFYADWCGPCKMIAPILEELQQEYKGKIQVYKVNVDNEQELAQVFQTQSIPTILFIPMQGQPQMAKGALPKETFEQAIKDVLKVSK